MQVREIARWRNRTPFEPFRLYLSDQQSYEVRHPEMISLYRYYISITLRTDEQGVILEYIEVDPAHIVRVEPLEPIEAQ